MNVSINVLQIPGGRCCQQFPDSTGSAYMFVTSGPDSWRLAFRLTDLHAESNQICHTDISSVDIIQSLAPISDLLPCKLPIPPGPFFPAWCSASLILVSRHLLPWSTSSPRLENVPPKMIHVRLPRYSQPGGLIQGKGKRMRSSPSELLPLETTW